MIGVKTVRLTDQNMEVLKDVADDVFDDRIDTERLRIYLAEKTHLLIVATMDSRVVGQAAAQAHPVQHIEGGGIDLQAHTVHGHERTLAR